MTTSFECGGLMPELVAALSETGREWTEADSEALDQQILEYRARKGLDSPVLQASQKAVTPDNCIKCNAPMRPQKSDPIPGTKVHLARGYCKACYNAAWRAEEFTPQPSRPDKKRRVELAQQLYREGKAVEVIAAVIGTTTRSVHRYLSQSREAS